MSYTAFFDLDHTILKINSGKMLLRRAYQDNLLSVRKVITAYFLAVLYKLKLLDPARIINRLATWLARFPVPDIERLCHEIVVNDLVPAIRPQILREIKRHREQGANVVILSSAIAAICVPLARLLEINTVICSELEEKDHRYTGLPIGKFCFREEKLDRMIRYLNTNKFTCKDSFYYGDSLDDLPVLAAVGYPVCINPDRGLRKIALKHQWVVHEWD